MSKRKETIVTRDRLIEIVKQFFFDWFDPSNMTILLVMTMNTYQLSPIDISLCMLILDYIGCPESH
jgi:hypothetical protein